MARCFAPTETCPERDKFGRTRPCDGRSYTPTSIHTEHGCVRCLSPCIALSGIVVTARTGIITSSRDATATRPRAEPDRHTLTVTPNMFHSRAASDDRDRSKDPHTPRAQHTPQFELHTPRAPRNMCLSGQPHGAASCMVRVIASVVDPGPIHGGTAPCSKLQCCPGNACPRPLDPAPPPPQPLRPRPLAPHFPK